MFTASLIVRSPAQGCKQRHPQPSAVARAWCAEAGRACVMRLRPQRAVRVCMVAMWPCCAAPCCAVPRHTLWGGSSDNTPGNSTQSRRRTDTIAPHWPGDEAQADGQGRSHTSRRYACMIYMCDTQYAAHSRSFCLFSGHFCATHSREAVCGAMLQNALSSSQ